MEEKIKIGDKVMIVENDEYQDYVKKKYGGILMVENIFLSEDGLEKLYKLQGIPNWARRSFIKKVN